MSSTISVCQVKQTATMIFFVPVAYQVVGMVFVDDRANIFEDG
jgi:hypothetical protein